MTDLDRFLATMEYRPVDRAPSHEIAVWAQTKVRWEAEGAPMDRLTFEWMENEDYFGLDRREYAPLDVHLLPLFREEIIGENDEYITKRHGNGIVTRGLKAGAIGDAHMSMDQYMSFAVETYEDWQELKKRLDPTEPKRLPAGWKENLLPGWKDREHVLAFPLNPQAGGFYWRAREFMGTELVSYSWYDNPKLMHDMMEFYADFMIEVSKPLLAETDVEYFTFNEDCAMKSGPLLSPSTFKEFIFEPLKRVVEFYKSNGVRYVGIDCDGAPELLVPLWMDAGIDFIWPMERASEGVDPVRYRKMFGKGLRLMGGVDKRVLTQGPAAIDAHLRELAPLVEEGGYIPTIDHAVPPDVSWDSFCYYMNSKQRLLEGKLVTSEYCSDLCGRVG